MRLFIIPFLLVLSSLSHADDKPKEVDSYESSFHFMIHDGDGFCLVCYTSIEKKPWGKVFEQLEITATIIEVYKGTRKIGDKIKFNRVLDGKYGDISHLQGSLQFVRFDKAHNPAIKNTVVDAQDPQAIFKFSEKLHKVARKHKVPEQTKKPIKMQNKAE